MLNRQRGAKTNGNKLGKSIFTVRMPQTYESTPCVINKERRVNTALLHEQDVNKQFTEQFNLLEIETVGI